MSSPATVGYPLRDIKLLFVNDRKNQCTYWLKPAIYTGKVKLTDLVRKFRPGCKIPGDRIYHQVLRHCKRLADLGYVKLEKQTTIILDKTFELQEKQQEESVQGIFAAAVCKDTPPIVSAGTSPTDTNAGISTVKFTDPAFYVVPTPNLFTLLSRVQNSNRFLESAKCRSEMGTLRGSLDWLKVQRHRCPYYLSGRTRGSRIEAVFKLRSLRKHSYFRRRDKRVVNPEVVRELQFIQTKFDQYMDDIEDLKCALVHKESGAIKLLDYQTRFTDEDRKKGTIARYHDTWRKAAESFNTAVFLTLTSFPPSEATKHQHRESLWHVNRHFAVAWNAYISLLQKRKRAARRDELLDSMRDQVRKVRPVRLDPAGKVKLTRDERTHALTPMKEENFRPKYLQVYEFQKNGMIHGHCVIFGSQWLDRFEQIKQDWVRLGQGERIHVYALHRENDTWQWSKAAPADSRNRQPVDYLGKYLIKGVVESSSHGMYWAVNKRFFTNSRALQEAGPEIDPALEKIPSCYSFLGAFKEEDIPPWLIPKKPAFSGPAGLFDSLGWGAGDPGGGVLA